MRPIPVFSPFPWVDGGFTPAFLLLLHKEPPRLPQRFSVSKLTQRGNTGWAGQWPLNCPTGFRQFAVPALHEVYPLSALSAQPAHGQSPASAGGEPMTLSCCTCGAAEKVGGFCLCTGSQLSRVRRDRLSKRVVFSLFSVAVCLSAPIWRSVCLVLSEAVSHGGPVLLRRLSAFPLFGRIQTSPRSSLCLAFWELFPPHLC